MRVCTFEFEDCAMTFLTVSHTLPLEVFSTWFIPMSDQIYEWKSIACKDEFESLFAPDGPGPDFRDTDKISVLEKRYRIHREHSVIVDITMLTAWRYIRRPHRAVIQKLIRVMKVCDTMQIYSFTSRKKAYGTSIRC